MGAAETLPWSREEFEQRLRAKGKRYHIYHPFHIAMNDALVVRELKCLADLRDNGKGLLRAQPTHALKPTQVCALDVFHQKIEILPGLPEVVDGDNVRMIQPGQGFCFTLKTFGKRGIFRGVTRKNF